MQFIEQIIVQINAFLGTILHAGSSASSWVGATLHLF